MPKRMFQLLTHILKENIEHGAHGDHAQRTEIGTVLASFDHEGLSTELRAIIDYVLETEQDNYVDWCQENELGIDSAEAISAHVYAYACKVLGHNPSFFINAEVAC